MKLAIVGTGISGLGAAWRLHGKHEIRVFEREGRSGGHSHTDDLPRLVRLFARNAELLDRETSPTLLANAANRLLHARNRNSRTGSRRNVRAHDDLGNDLYETFLDPSMTCSCALFETGNETLQEAQEKKLRRIAEKVRIRLVDYRNLPAEGRTYDRVVSIEMLKAAVSARSRLLVHHLEDVGVHYAGTLRLWRKASLANQPRVRQLGYDKRSTRLRDFYLAYREGGFAARHIGDVQVVLTRSGNGALGPVPGYRGAA